MCNANEKLLANLGGFDVATGIVGQVQRFDLVYKRRWTSFIDVSGEYLMRIDHSSLQKLVVFFEYWYFEEGTQPWSPRASQLSYVILEEISGNHSLSDCQAD